MVGHWPSTPSYVRALYPAMFLLPLCPAMTLGLLGRQRNTDMRRRERHFQHGIEPDGLHKSDASD
ncbi:hypothetical protein E5D57_004706 [Metarhizium anisopliae]|nr:hypothetical protein E5D57_004706 [Metarhizium anisopliae]